MLVANAIRSFAVSMLSFAGLAVLARALAVTWLFRRPGWLFCWLILAVIR
jgi:hypothetical protein